MGNWDNLSMRDKRDVMRLHIKNGIRDLNGIRESYNYFGDGGDTDVVSAKQEVLPTSFLYENIKKDNIKDYNLEDYRGVYKNYMNDPSYKERLSMEMYGTLNTSEQQKLDVDNKYNERVDQLSTIPLVNTKYDKSYGRRYEFEGNIKTGNYDIENNKVNANYYSAFHEISHAIDSSAPPPGGRKEFFANDTWKYYTSPEMNGAGYLNKLNEFVKPSETFDYFKAPGEIKARINDLKLKAYSSGLYRPGEDFNINDPRLKSLRNSDGYKELIKDVGITDEQINELSKYIAQTDRQLPDNFLNNNIT